MLRSSQDDNSLQKEAANVEEVLQQKHKQAKERGEQVGMSRSKSKEVEDDDDEAEKGRGGMGEPSYFTKTMPTRRGKMSEVRGVERPVRNLSTKLTTQSLLAPRFA